MVAFCTITGIAVADERPNVLLIVTDDQSPETLSCYGPGTSRTPTIDRLAAEGMVLTDAHHMGSWSGAVCTCSRTMLMTGRTLWRIPGAKGWRYQDMTADQSRRAIADQSLPAVFNRAGYDTFRTCKIGNSFGAANARFDIDRSATKRDGTAEDGSAWHAEQVLSYLDSREASEDDDPFLIYLGFSHPHDPRNPTPELAAKYGVRPAAEIEPTDAAVEGDDRRPAVPVNWLPAHPFPHGHPGLRDEEKVEGVLRRRDVPIVRNELAREAACIENIDVQIARCADRLAVMGELENTYVIFTSDHGIAVGRHGLLGKQNLYEHTWRVPLIVRGPDIKAGSRASGYVYLLDIMPTLCDLCGIDVPETVEGISFEPVLTGEKDTVRDALYGAYAGGTKPGLRAVKTDGWKLIEYDVIGGAVRRTQLFDLRANPHEFLTEHHDADVTAVTGATPTAEQINLADDPRYAEKRAELSALLKTMMDDLDDPYPLSPPRER